MPDQPQNEPSNPSIKSTTNSSSDGAKDPDSSRDLASQDSKDSARNSVGSNSRRAQAMEEAKSVSGTIVSVSTIRVGKEMVNLEE